MTKRELLEALNGASEDAEIIFIPWIDAIDSFKVESAFVGQFLADEQCVYLYGKEE